MWSEHQLCIIPANTIYHWVLFSRILMLSRRLNIYSIWNGSTSYWSNILSSYNCGIVANMIPCPDCCSVSWMVTYHILFPCSCNWCYSLLHSCLFYTCPFISYTLLVFTYKYLNSWCYRYYFYLTTCFTGPILLPFTLTLHMVISFTHIITLLRLAEAETFQACINTT